MAVRSRLGRQDEAPLSIKASAFAIRNKALFRHSSSHQDFRHYIRYVSLLRDGRALSARATRRSSVDKTKLRRQDEAPSSIELVPSRFQTELYFGTSPHIDTPDIVV
nr:hypothetical protein CFP56_52127 [Quercus suber]